MIEDCYSKNMLRSEGYIFHHIPKTAGTTFNFSYLPIALPDQYLVLNGNFELTPSGNVAHKTRLLNNPSYARSIKVICGHNAQDLRELLPNYKCLTIVRDPVERAISWYLHERFHEGQIPENRRRAETIEPDEWVEQAMTASYSTGFVWSLADHFFSKREQDELFVSSDEVIVQKAHQKFAYIGISEHFSDFIFILYLREGFPLALYRKQMVRKERGSIVVTEEQRERIAQVFAPSVRMYSVLKDHFINSLLGPLTAEENSLREQYKLMVKRFESHEDSSSELGILLEVRCGELIPVDSKKRRSTAELSHNLAALGGP